MTLSRQDYKGRKRYQLTYVNRSDKITPYVKELSDEDIDLPPLRIVSYGDDRVGELWDLADQFRRNHSLEQRIQERKDSSTLIKDLIEVSQEIQKIKRNQTLFGAGKTNATKQRIGFHRKGK